MLVVSILLVAVPILGSVWRKRHIDPMLQKGREELREAYGQKMRSQFGEPVQSLWTEGVPVLFYDGFVVIEGVQVPFDSIISATWNNTDTPWGSGDYQVIVRTSLPDHEFLYAQMGGDKEEAISMVEQIHSRMQK